MTRENDEVSMSNKIIIVTDMCSSSDIIEEVTLNGQLQALRNFFISIKEFLKKKSRILNFEIYKFTGDGWILLFSCDSQMKKIIEFLQELSNYFQIEFDRRLKPAMNTFPNSVGLSFGADEGQLVKLEMLRQKEYIGRSLNIACRLQSRINSEDNHNEYKMLISNTFYSHYRQDFLQFNPRRVERTLKNIRGGKRFRCVLLTLMPNTEYSLHNRN